MDRKEVWLNYVEWIILLQNREQLWVLVKMVINKLFAVLQIGSSLVRSHLMTLEFFIDIKSFWSHYGPGVDSASNRNEYQEYFLGVKAAGA